MIPLPMLHTLVTVLALITIIDLAVTVAGMLEFERVLDSVSQVVQDVAARAGGTWQWGSSAVSDGMRELSQDTVERLRWAVNGVINATAEAYAQVLPEVPGAGSSGHHRLFARTWARAARIRRFTESRGSDWCSALSPCSAKLDCAQLGSLIHNSIGEATSYGSRHRLPGSGFQHLRSRNWNGAG